MSQPKIIFVGALKETTTGHGIGGQAYACQSLVNSNLSNHVTWLKIDSTMLSMPPPPQHTRLYYALKRLIRFRKLIANKESSAALIFTSARLSFVEKGVMVLLARLYRKPALLYPRSGILLDDLEKSEFMRRYIPYILCKSSVVLCQSKIWKTTYQELTALPDERFSIVPNWINVSDYPIQNRQTESRSVRFLYLGWIEEHKGIFDLIQAVANHRDLFKQTGSIFIICGQGRHTDRAHAFIDQHQVSDLFEFRGWVYGESKTQVLQEVDVLVLPSHREGFPNALLEGMASGLAIVATDVGAIPEVIEHGVSGMIVDAKSPSQLGHALVQVNSNHIYRQSLSEQARIRVTQYDLDTVWPKLLDTIQDTITQSVSA